MFNLNESLSALEGRTEFAIKRYDDLVCLDYILCFPGSFSASDEEIALHGEEKAKRHAWIRRNCRGMVFSEKTGELVSLPLHKFFNVDQTPETQFPLLSGCKAKIYEKMDGSMIHFFVHPDRKELLAATCRSTETPQAKESLAMAKKNPLVLQKILNIIEEGYTPVFEFVAAHNQIVVQYPRPRLVYLISRHRETGKYKFHDGFPDCAAHFEFPFSEIKGMLDKEEFEGYVCHLEFDNGDVDIVKAKTPWYMERHKAVDSFMRPMYKLYGVVFDGIMDDLLPIAPDLFKPKLTAIYEEAQRDLLDEKLRLDRVFAKCLSAMKAKFPKAELDYPARKDNKVLRKTFVEFAQKHFPCEFSKLMTLYIGQEPTKEIKETLMDLYKEMYPHRMFADMEYVEEVAA